MLLYIVENKLDLIEQLSADVSAAQEWGKTHLLPILLISALTGDAVQPLAKRIGDDLSEQSAPPKSFRIGTCPVAED
jgi:50S ribosomal subunit-associated GTPase HflX